ncbi:MAG: hypothetical protein ACT4PP_08630 [Sporichthyaceae bacterium]
MAGPITLQGVLTDAAGNALGGAQVLVSAWPSGEQVHRMTPGEGFDLVPMARTVAGRDGSYELRSLVTPLLASLTGRDGLDIELDVFHGDRHYVYLSQLRLEGGEWVHGAANGVDGQVTRATETAVPNLLNLALNPGQGERLNVAAPSSTWPPPTSEGEPAFDKRDKPIPGGGSCSRIEKINREPHTAFTTIATAIVSNGVKVSTSYTKGATTVTSTGFSFDGGLSFGINGARERTSTYNPEFRDWRAGPGRTIARDYRVEFEHDVLRRVCFANANLNRYRVQYLTSPGGLTGGGDDIPSRYPIFGCDDKRVARAVYKSVSTENASASTYQAAFGFAPLAGASFVGSALSGYSDAVKIKYSFSERERGQWCGHTGKPLHPGQRLHGYQK